MHQVRMTQAHRHLISPSATLCTLTTWCTGWPSGPAGRICSTHPSSSHCPSLLAGPRQQRLVAGLLLPLRSAPRSTMQCRAHRRHRRGRRRRRRGLGRRRGSRAHLAGRRRQTPRWRPRRRRRLCQGRRLPSARCPRTWAARSSLKLTTSSDTSPTQSMSKARFAGKGDWPPSLMHEMKATTRRVGSRFERPSWKGVEGLART